MATKNFRFPTSYNLATRTSHACKTLVVELTTPAVVNNIKVSHFELKEDPSLWMDHNV